MLNICILCYNLLEKYIIAKLNRSLFYSISTKDTVAIALPINQGNHYFSKQKHIQVLSNFVIFVILYFNNFVKINKTVSGKNDKIFISLVDFFYSCIFGE